MEIISTMELFCGTKSFTKVAELKGFMTITLDNDEQHDPDIRTSVLNISSQLPKFDYLWASPPCTAFSVASMKHHWGGGFRKYLPISENARHGIRLLDKTIEIISVSNPKKWYIENPRGVMRKVIDGIFAKYQITKYRRVTVCYCQYGDSRMKPTDIWTNDLDWVPRQMCKNNNPSCHHERAPRGSKTGTQGLKNNVERGKIPPQLFEDIFRGAK